MAMASFGVSNYCQLKYIQNQNPQTMAQGNMLLGMARGSVGDVTFARSARKQVSRARNRKPNNPRTLAQIRQRILLKTAALAYSVFAKDFADQTFEGATDARENQQRFIKLNIKMLRDNISATDSLYASKDSVAPPLNKYILADGVLNGGGIRYGQGGIFMLDDGSLEPPIPQIATFTYADCANMLGVPVGSQITFLSCNGSSDNGWLITEVKRARLVLAPADGDVTKVMFASATSLNDPHPDNDGILEVATANGIEITTRCKNKNAAAVVSSYDKKWRYSHAELKIIESAHPGNNFEEAVESWQRASMSESEEYTRQAE